ncbi:hypothetical protein [Aeromonas phage AS-yj]|uniref:Uncharacterized protein n=4 Tax=Caudoviricetes TaxID=2731619 RepID=A0A411B7T3_9CAUD|nr:hypothetical protein HWB28_gp190 [Aeromonas phage AS-zj]ATI17873.1 hypothetical protein [Aeromonas phage AS-yj]QAX97668.1 hypothetical protein ASswx1_22 [Aeromonas phage Asswx_1]QAX98886.1 hypothetical protein assk_88 [Aeromonas phage Assk]QMV29124.1 hypothetical protein AP1_0421 [Aeromonas phage AP1]UKM62702.1 hypothetical protein P19_0214 [Aeromonas phage P19]
MKVRFKSDQCYDEFMSTISDEIVTSETSWASKDVHDIFSNIAPDEVFEVEFTDKNEIKAVNGFRPFDEGSTFTVMFKDEVDNYLDFV